MHISRYKTTQDSCHILQTQQKLPNGNKHEPVYSTHLYFLSYYEPIALSYFFTLVISTFLLKTCLFLDFFLPYFRIVTCNIFCSFFPLMSIFWEQVEEKQGRFQQEIVNVCISKLFFYKRCAKIRQSTLQGEEPWQVPRKMRNLCSFANDVSQKFPELGLEISLCVQGSHT